MKPCKLVRGLLVLVAGIELFVNVPTAGLTGAQIAGLAFVLFGLIVVIHALGMCSACEGCCSEPAKKK